MRTELQGLAFRWLVKTQTVPVADCVHYGAFRYGRGEFNPYENYAVALASGGPMDVAREQFVDFLRYYRPRHIGEALGVALSREYALWRFPWSLERPDPRTSPAGWAEAPNDVPDILTHFSACGILRARIEEEFSWLERAFHSIREHGYRPDRFTGHIEAQKLVAADGRTMHLITDGNHRLSALAALGQTTVVVRYRRRMTVKERALLRWPQVLTGSYSPEDARLVFRAYFDGNRQPRTTDVPAPVLESNPMPTP
jgi:hypothetical protein